MTKLESPAGEIQWEETPGGIVAKGKLPAEAAFFCDHFPRYPVLPGVLTLEIFKRIAEDFSASKAGKQNAGWRLASLSGVRFSAYLRPGAEWEAQMQKDGEFWKASLSSGGNVAAKARFIIEPVRAFSGTVPQSQ